MIDRTLRRIRSIFNVYHSNCSYSSVAYIGLDLESQSYKLFLQMRDRHLPLYLSDLRFHLIEDFLNVKTHGWPSSFLDNM